MAPNTRLALALCSCNFFDNPSKKMKVIGVTGTKGKTTTTFMIKKILEKAGKKVGLIGTIATYIGDKKLEDSDRTTPESNKLQEIFAKMVEENVEYGIMEVSSHALEQNRVGGCRFNGAILTNLTQDHLDYHITMENYFEAKSILFKNLQEGCFAVINNDDEWANRFLNIIPEDVKVITYGIKNNADIMAENIDFSLNGAEFNLKIKNNEYKISLHMNGMFSVYNVLAAVAASYAMGIDISVAIKALESTKGVAGRFEVVNKKPLVIVDYAHTPDGLENVLKSAREITPTDSNLICLFGCGGDRDATKRPKMGAIAENLADKIVITSDNPRSEDPQQIITDIIAGLKTVNPDKVTVEQDRGKAIKLLKDIANNNDVILIAGKGHEDYQILKDKTIHFDDREEAKKVFEGV